RFKQDEPLQDLLEVEPWKPQEAVGADGHKVTEAAIEATTKAATGATTETAADGVLETVIQTVVGNATEMAVQTIILDSTDATNGPQDVQATIAPDTKKHKRADYVNTYL
ncbi:hypothetical protein BGX21_007560, partial [Mortierella sp. AD011]